MDACKTCKNSHCHNTKCNCCPNVYQIHDKDGKLLVSFCKTCKIAFCPDCRAISADGSCRACFHKASQKSEIQTAVQT